MVNIIWCIFIIVGIIFCLITNKLDIINTEILNSTKTSLDMIMKIFPVMALWLGIMNVAKVSGLLEKISITLSPLLRKLFPEIPKSHESISLIASNVIANMFGLGNAATPFGLKAMKSLQSINNKNDTASRSMITFLVLNTSGLTIIPTTIISMKMMYGSTTPTDIVVPCLIASFISTTGGIIMDRILARGWRKHDK